MKIASKYILPIRQNQAISPQAGRTGFRSAAPHAFTLVELMISIALSLLLILGVNQVFTYTTQAVGAGEAINSAIRTSRAVQATLAADMGGIVGNGSGPTDAACLIISSRASYGYRNAKDLASEGDVSLAPTGIYPTNNAAFVDINGDGKFGDPTIPGEIVYPCVYNFRNHRLDCLSFFSRDTFHRQTGNLGTFVDNMASTEAWIWYGHLWLPDNAGNYPPPPSSGNPQATFPLAGAPSSNPNNFFASQLVLGRMNVLLQEKSTDTVAGTISDTQGYSQRFLNRQIAYPWNTAAPPTAAIDLEPLSANSFAATANGDSTSWFLQDGRFDLAATTIANFRNKLQSFLGNASLPSSTPLWYDQMLDGNPTPVPAFSSSNVGTRLKCNPYVPKPMDAAAMATASPYFVSGCSQFIVEFAGDFLTQDNDPTHVDNTGKPYRGSPATHTGYGEITSTALGSANTPIQPDGQIDFSVVNVGTTASPSYVKQIKWYGMPRGTSGNSTVSYANGDVVPLRDWLLNVVNPTTLAPNQQPSAAFEKAGPAYPTNNPVDYSHGSSTGGMSISDAQRGYICAFGPNDPKPKLIRITITLEDPTGRLPDGQTYQYIFPVP